MLDRYAMFVDAGYILAAGGWAVTGKYHRHESVCDTEALIGWLIGRAAADHDGRELLRLYWYDAAQNRTATRDQLTIAELDDTKLRLGHLTTEGVQKGVDAMLLSDLTTLSRERSIRTAIVVAGDGDFAEAVLQAQQSGTRVVLWAVATPSPTLSPELRREADRVEVLSAADLQAFFSPAPPRVGATKDPSRAVAGSVSSELPVYATIITDDALAIGRRFAAQWAGMTSDGEVAVVAEDEPRIPPELDARLIRFALDSANLRPATRLAPESLRTLREGFWAGVAAARR